jgi:lipoprotein-releasing system permease protein
MRYETLVAVRYFRRRAHSRFLSFMTAVTVGGVAVGVAALGITFSILGGFERALSSNIIGMSSHVQVTTFHNLLMPDDTARLAAIRALPAVRAARAMLQREALVVTRDNIDGVLLKGAPSGAAFDALSRRLVAGRAELTDSGGRRECVVGRRFAERAGVGLGDRVVFIGVSSAEDAMTAPRVPCTITGLYETGMAEYFDDVAVYTSLATAQAVFSASGAVNGYDVLCTDPAHIDRTVDRLQELLGYPFDPRSVFSLYRNLFVWIDLQKQLVPIVVGSLVIIAVFNIISTLLLLVIEKTSAIGILRSLGASRSGIRRIFVRHGLLVSSIGAGLGALLAFALCAAQEHWRFFRLPQDVYYMTTVPIHLSPEVFLLPAAAAVLLSLLASFVPAWLAARLNPITSIRFH